jgi:hypothetical protein
VKYAGVPADTRTGRLGARVRIAGLHVADPRSRGMGRIDSRRIARDFQLDARAGLGLARVSGPDYFVGIGAARRW